MDQNFLQSQKKKLEEQVTRVEADLATFAVKTNGPGGYTAKYPNVGDEMEENVQEMVIQEEQVDEEHNLEDLLEQTRRALKRLEAGSYGQCLICGAPIETKRLEAAPEAEECKECAQI